MGEIISHVTPFCGRHSIKNPKHVYEAPETKLGISLSQYGVVSKIRLYLWHFFKDFFLLLCFKILTIAVRTCIFTSSIFHFKVCFAYLGPINPVLGVTYKFYDKTTLTTSSATNYLTIANAEASTT